MMAWRPATSPLTLWPNTCGLEHWKRQPRSVAGCRGISFAMFDHSCRRDESVGHFSCVVATAR
jgi:hypothetical protein